MAQLGIMNNCLCCARRDHPAVDPESQTALIDTSQTVLWRGRCVRPSINALNHALFGTTSRTLLTLSGVTVISLIAGIVGVNLNSGIGGMWQVIGKVAYGAAFFTSGSSMAAGCVIGILHYNDHPSNEQLFNGNSETEGFFGIPVSAY